MKKVILGLMLLTTVGATTMAFTSLEEKGECQYGQCSYIKKDGYRCKNCAQEGSYYCWSHNHQ